MAKGELLLDHYLAMSPGEDDSIDGIDTIEPSFGLPAKWITEKRRKMRKCSDIQSLIHRVLFLLI